MEELQIRTPQQQRLEHQHGPLGAYMVRWWSAEVAKGGSPTVEDLAAHLEVHWQTVRAWLVDYKLRLATMLVPEP